ncbi:MAG: hypothetical protein KAJ19_25575 [Gammaproteobacteria bacterium]|nr:hypothetical protein [Gammaproteobacteria bacterium]
MPFTRREMLKKFGAVAAVSFVPTTEFEELQEEVLATQDFLGTKRFEFRFYLYGKQTQSLHASTDVKEIRDKTHIGRKTYPTWRLAKDFDFDEIRIVVPFEGEEIEVTLQVPRRVEHATKGNTLTITPSALEGLLTLHA